MQKPITYATITITVPNPISNCLVNEIAVSMSFMGTARIDTEKIINNPGITYPKKSNACCTSSFIIVIFS
jgi:hypothetical protein